MEYSHSVEFIKGVGSGFSLGAMVGGTLGFANGFMNSGQNTERFRTGVAHLKLSGGDYGNLFARFNGVVTIYKIGLQKYGGFTDLSSTFMSLPLAAATLSARQGVKYAIKNGVQSTLFALCLFGFLAYKSIPKQ